MIGNETDAYIALRDYQSGNLEFLFSDDGTSRSVHEINGVLYKVERDWRTAGINNFEYYQSLNLSLPHYARIPKMSLFTVNCDAVLAIEKINGTPVGECVDRIIGYECETPDNCLDDLISEELRAFGWDDQATGNAIKFNGLIYLVDIA